jgi:hypothetical protein
MTTFSQPQGCLTQSQIDAITTTDTITISSIDTSSLSTYSFTGLSATDTITWSGTNCHSSQPYYTTNNTGTVTIGASGAGYSTISTTSGPVTIGTFDISSIQDILTSSEWKSAFPDWNRIQKMCDMYPGLKIAFEKFKTTYYLVKDDYDNPNTKK